MLVGLLAFVGAAAPAAPPALAQLAPPAVPAKPDGAVAVAELRERIDKLGGKLGAAVITVGDGKLVASHDANVPRNPASNAKIPTAIAALTALGPEHRFDTGLFGRQDGATVPELVLRGRGDPGFSTEDVRGLVRTLRARGITKVESITVDQSAFSEWLPPAFEQQPGEWAAFRASVAPVSLDRNVITLWIKPGDKAKDAALITVDPPGFVEISGAIRTGAADSPEKLELELAPQGERLVATLRGSVPVGDRLVPIVKRADDPRALAGYALRAVLREQGLTVGDKLTVAASKQRALLAITRSAPLGELVHRLGKDSDNFTAEMLLLALAAKKGEATFAGGAKLIEAELTARQALDPGTVVKNGSGLFDANRYTARSLAQLLAAGARDPRIAHELIAHLAIAGVDGTMKNRLSRWEHRRAIRAKTGTLSSVVALSGYVLGPDGAPVLAFSFLVEGVKGKTKEARDAIDKAVDRLAEGVLGKP